MAKLGSAVGAASRNKRLGVFVTIALVVFGAVAYFFRLRSVPQGYYHDTGAVMLNAECLAATGADEYGRRWPFLGLESFGEGKAPGFTFLLSVFARVFRMTPLLSRIVSASAGFLAVTTMFVFAYVSRQTPRPRRPWVLSLGYCLCLMSPWVLAVHRFPTECTLVDLVVIANLVFAYEMLRTRRFRYAVMNGICVGLGGYVYHSLKVMLVLHPFIVGASLWQSRRKGRGRKADFELGFLNIAIAIAVSASLIRDMLKKGESMRRFKGQNGFDDSWVVRISRYFWHLDVNFLFLSGDKNLVEHTGFMGELSLGLLPFLVGGSVLAYRAAKKGDPFWTYALLMALLGLAPAALAPDAPHSLHSNAATMPILLISLLGLFSFDRYVSLRRRPFSWRFRLGAGAFAVAAGWAFVYGMTWYFGRGYADASKDSWRPTADISAELAKGDKGLDIGDHKSGSVYVRAGNVAQGDLRYCNRKDVGSPIKDAGADATADVDASASPVPRSPTQ